MGLFSKNLTIFKGLYKHSNIDVIENVQKEENKIS